MEKSLNLGTLGERVSIVTHVGYYSNGNTYHVYATHSAYPCKHVAHTRKTHAHERFLNRIFQFFTTFSTITRKESCE